MRSGFTPREVEEIERMWIIHARYKGAACRPVGEWLVKQAKRTWPRSAGWWGPSKTNSKRCWTLVSYHHPAQLCWLWSVWLQLFPTDGRWWAFCGGYGKNRCFQIKYLFRVSLHRQPDYAWMLSSAGKQRLCAVADGQLGAARPA